MEGHNESIFVCVNWIRMILNCVNPNLPDPVNFIPFGMMRYSIFAINLINIHEHTLHMFVFEQSLHISLSNDI